MSDKEYIEIAKKYKKRVAGSFVLVDGNEITSKISGTGFVATKKIDGAYQAICYENGEAFAVSSSGNVVKGIPCLNEAASLLKKQGITSAVIASELYTTLEDGKRERVGDVSKALADSALQEKLKLAPFDIAVLDGEEFKSDRYLDTLQKLYGIFDGSLVRPVEYRELYSPDDIVKLYKDWVEDHGAEGIVLHSELPIVYKIKPRHSVDGAIVGFTCGEGDRADLIRDIAVALMHEDGKFQIIAVTGNGFSDDQRKSLLKDLDPLACSSEYILTDSRNVGFQMVKPKMIVELLIGDFVAEGSDGTPKTNPLLSYDDNTGYLSEGNTPGVAALHPVFVRFRDDKSFDKTDIRISQVTDICPFSEGKSSKLNDLPKSEVLAKRIFTKGSGDKLMIQKYVVWKTNKEASGVYPAYVFFYTDFSPGRKEMLKRDLRVSSDKDQIMAFMESSIAENVKKGWVEKE